eukprot:526818-Rhodomonas_salina.1
MGFPVLGFRMLLWDVRYWDSVCCHGMSGTGIAYAAMGYPEGAIDGRGGAVNSAICLRACYAMSGTEIACGG